MTRDSMEETVQVILKKFFNKRFVVQRPRPFGMEVIQGRFVTPDELNDLVQFAYEQGLKEKRKRKKLEQKK